MTRRRFVVLVSVLAGLAACTAVLVLPAYTWVGQQLDVEAAEAELADLRAANDELGERIERLSEDEAIERQARAEFGLVYPGEESYMVPPPGAPTVNLPRVWPFDLLQEPLARAAQRTEQVSPAERDGG